MCWCIECRNCPCSYVLLQQNIFVTILQLKIGVQAVSLLTSLEGEDGVTSVLCHMAVGATKSTYIKDKSMQPCIYTSKAFF